MTLDLRAFAATLGSARLWPWLPLAIACYLAGHVVRGARCRRLTSRDANLPLGAATQVVVLGYAINNLLPARLGEFARAGMLAERGGVPYVQALTITVLERVLDGLTLLLFLVVALALAPAAAGMATSARIAAVVLGGAALLVGAAVIAPGALLGLAGRAAGGLGHRGQDRAVGIAEAIVHGVAYLRRPGDALRVAVLSALVWTCEAGMFLLLLPAFGLPLRPATALLAMTVTNLGILVPSTPGYVGVFHFLCMQAVMATGVGRDTALGYATLVHLAFYVPITLWGVGILFAYGLSLGRALRLSRSAETSAGPLAAPPAVTSAEIPYSLGQAAARVRAPGPFLLALTEALIPIDTDGMAGVERARVIAATARFVQGQTEALPTALRALLQIGLAGFRIVTALTQGRSFVGLAPARRRAWAEAWAYGRVTPARQLFRPLRSTALLAYYELEDVRAHRATAAPDPAEARDATD